MSTIAPEKTAAELFAEGDIIVNSWGYDQTNVDFYQVVSVTAKSIMLRSISGKTTEGTGDMQGHKVPVKDDFTSTSAPTRHFIGHSGHVRFKYGSGCKWNGKPCWFSSYA